MKKWIIGVLCVTLCIVLAVGTANFLVDPLMQYRLLPQLFSFAAYSYAYINPGVARNTDYDAVLVGTSLAENADMDVYENAFGCRMIRMIYPGGTTRNFALILDVAFRAHMPALVLWSVDDTLFLQDGSEFNHAMPEYLDDDSRLNDVSYLLNLSVFYNFTCKDVALSLAGRSDRPILRHDVWSEKQKFGKDAVLAAAKAEAEQSGQEDTADLPANAADNLQTHILPMLRAHPDTRFDFFFPPKCVTYWQTALQNGSFDAKFQAMRYVVQTLLGQENARVFFFADRMEWTTDYELYKDGVHFKQSVNNAMGEAIAQGESELTQDSFDAVLQSAEQALRNAAAP